MLLSPTFVVVTRVAGCQINYLDVQVQEVSTKGSDRLTGLLLVLKSFSDPSISPILYPLRDHCLSHDFRGSAIFPLEKQTN